MDCLFCKIAEKQIPSNIIHEDEVVVAFEDVNPKAPHHVLIIPRQHIATVNDLTAEHKDLISHMILTAQQLASELNIADSGYRLLMNCNKDGGQDVYHIHLHLLGGRPMHWPPG